MSIPPDSRWRGCAANFAQPVGEEDICEAERLSNSVHSANCLARNPPLSGIVYRSSDRERDVLRHVFRWDPAPYEQIFENGFQARSQEGTPNATYFDLVQHVHHSGRPLDPTRSTMHAFVSTTLDSGWRPQLTLQPGEEIQVYRYEIYAPGGIWVAQTLGDLYRYPAQDEVCFVGGIAPQYIRSAQLFIATGQAGSRFPRWRRADSIKIINGYYNPQSHPSRVLNIQRPVTEYIAENGTRKLLKIKIYGLQLSTSESDRRRVERQISEDDATITWYTDDVANIPIYIDAAFRSSNKDEAYIFMNNEYALLNYAPGTTDDKIINGPLLICDGYPSLIGTAFGEHGIDCAFDSDGNKAFIFSGNLCAFIDYAPGTTDDKILSGPMTITAMFPFFKGTVFENGIDAAFRSSRSQEAYLFKGDQYALIDYDSKNLIAIRNITQGFYSLRGTIFESGIDAAFASHREDEAYLFKGDQYALINFAPGTADDSIIWGVKPIFPSWPSLRGILPRTNRGLDVHDHHNQPQADRDHDEL